MADGRDPQRLRYGLRDTLLSGYAMFFLQHPSLLQFQESMKRKRGRCNLEVMFGVSAVPSETQMRESSYGFKLKTIQYNVIFVIDEQSIT